MTKCKIPEINLTDNVAENIVKMAPYLDEKSHRQEIFRLVNKRMEDGNITIYTSNMSTDTLNVDNRTRDRIIKTSIELRMPEESIRKKEAAREQKTFLASVMG